MAALASFTKFTPIKLLFVGKSGSGKTGALASLATAGYNLRIIDTDKGVDIIHDYLKNPESPYYKQNPKAIENVSVVQLSDSMKSVNGVLVPTKATIWQRLTGLLVHWKDGDEDFGPVQSWGEKDILVLDSLWGAAKFALNFHLFMNGLLGKARTSYEGMRDIGTAQTFVKSLLELLYDDNIKCNIIVISHITNVTEAGGAAKIEEGRFNQNVTGYAASIGRAIAQEIPKWFNNMIISRETPRGSETIRRIYTTSQNLGTETISAKTSAPLRVKPEYPLESGLADFFADLRRV